MDSLSGEVSWIRANCRSLHKAPRRRAMGVAATRWEPRGKIMSSGKLRYGLIGTGMMALRAHRRTSNCMPGHRDRRRSPIRRRNRSSLTASGDWAMSSSDKAVVYRRCIARCSRRRDCAMPWSISSPNLHPCANALPADVGGQRQTCAVREAADDDDRGCTRGARAGGGGLSTASFGSAMEYRYMPPVGANIMRRGGSNGRIGTLADARDPRASLSVPRRRSADWNRFSHNTGGTMVEKCCHFFDLMRLIVKAKPVRVYLLRGNGRQPSRRAL